MTALASLVFLVTYLASTDALWIGPRCHTASSGHDLLTLTKEEITRRFLLGFLSACTVGSNSVQLSGAFALDSSLLEMRYSSEWIGTSLPLLSLNDAVAREQWQMARWPDPILRRPADPVGKEYFSTNILQIACSRLKQTAIREGAVGLAAQQCGVNARIIYLSDIHSISLTRALPSIMINPSIVWRSPEIVAKVWNEQCLVLPPTFTATVLRDSSVDVVYQTIDGEVAKIRLVGEASRCVQHELDHDRGILLTDHVGLEDLENDLMRSIERLGHEERMALAFSRSLND